MEIFQKSTAELCHIKNKSINIILKTEYLIYDLNMYSKNETENI